MVPSSDAETTEGTSASPLLSRMTTGAPSFTNATRLLVVPRSMPTTLDIRRHLPLEAREQVVDVIAFEHAVAERFEYRPALCVGRAALEECVPLREELLELRLVRSALRVDRTASALEARGQLFRRCPSRAHLAYFVELLVQREYLFEKIRWHLLGCFLWTARCEAFDLQQVFQTCYRVLQRAVRVVQIRRPLEARAALRGCRIKEVIGVELSAQPAKPLLQIVRADVQLPGQAKEREIVAVPPN